MVFSWPASNGILPNRTLEAVFSIGNLAKCYLEAVFSTGNLLKCYLEAVAPKVKTNHFRNVSGIGLGGQERGVGEGERNLSGRSGGWGGAGGFAPKVKNNHLQETILPVALQLKTHHFEKKINAGQMDFGVLFLWWSDWLLGAFFVVVRLTLGCFFCGGQIDFWVLFFVVPLFNREEPRGWKRKIFQEVLFLQCFFCGSQLCFFGADLIYVEYSLLLGLAWGLNFSWVSATWFQIFGAVFNRDFVEVRWTLGCFFCGCQTDFGVLFCGGQMDFGVLFLVVPLFNREEPRGWGVGVWLGSGGIMCCVSEWWCGWLWRKGWGVGVWLGSGGIMCCVSGVWEWRNHVLCDGSVLDLYFLLGVGRCGLEWWLQFWGWWVLALWSSGIMASNS